MLELSRTVRFAVNPGLASGPDSAAGRHNTFAGWPSMVGLGAHYEMAVRCRGEVDPELGFLVNISDIDEAVRRQVIPLVQHAMRVAPLCDPAELMPSIMGALREVLPEAYAVTWRLTPFYSLTLEGADMAHVLLSQHFEFAASHRLHCPSLSDGENRRVYGKCNNPAGHGHNYRLEVVISRPIAGLPLDRLEAIVAERVIRRFDHTNLNVDTEEFARLSPSVEHIARVCFELLDEPISRAGGCLVRTTVWETEKTSCTYEADRPHGVGDPRPGEGV